MPNEYRQRIGQMRERLMILTPTETKDTQGGQTVTWATLATVSGELIPRTASERLSVAAVQAQIDHRFRVRARTDVTEKMRVRWTPSWGGAVREFEISGVVPYRDGRTYMDVDCGRIT